MYTKCPMPTYCPMMDRNFVEVQKQIKASPALADKARLLSVSFDPKNDTPAVLKQHAKKLGADPALWTFVTGDAGRDRQARDELRRDARSRRSRPIPMRSATRCAPRSSIATARW